MLNRRVVLSLASAGLIFLVLDILFNGFSNTVNFKSNDDGETTNSRTIPIYKRECNVAPTDRKYPCVTVKPTPNLSFPICTYTSKEDDTISAAFLNGGYFDWGRVSTIIKQLSLHEDAHFIDIGSNIGAYTVAVGNALGRPVLAIEPNLATIHRLRQSVCDGNITSKVTLLHAVISNSSWKLVRLANNNVNRGVTVALEGTDCVLTRNKINCMNETTVTLTLDDVAHLIKSQSVIMKVDAEGSEPKIFNDATASRFFSQIAVRYIFMEFQYFTMFYSKPNEKRAIVDKMLEFFSKRGYDVVADDLKTTLTYSKWDEWPADVVFVKK